MVAEHIQELERLSDHLIQSLRAVGQPIAAHPPNGAINA
jgi:tetrahydromethanopterin S-methyltransferase subunit B